MLNFLQRKIHPIGIDLGSSSLKLVQLTDQGGRLSLIAAAQREVPHEIQTDPAAFQEWYVTNIKETLSSKPFKGRKAITCLPAREMLIQHMRLAKMDDDQLAKALPWEAQGKMPFDVNHAMLRHVVAGEVYEGSQSKLEVILMAASRHVVHQHLSLIERTKIEIESINVEPNALLNCFGHLLEQDQGSSGAVMFIDLGHSSTKVVIFLGTKLTFARTIGIGSEHIRRAFCDTLGVDYDQAVDLHYNLDQASPRPDTADQPILSENNTTTATATIAQSQTADTQKYDTDKVITLALQNLSEEIRSCIRYHDLMFNTHQVERVIFLGGQAKNTFLSQQLAQQLNLPAQLGDPLARVDSAGLIGPHSDLEQHQHHSEWAIAFGLSLGGVN